MQSARNKEAPFTADLDKFEKLSLFKKNIGSLIEEMKFYFDIRK